VFKPQYFGETGWRGGGGERERQRQRETHRESYAGGKKEDRVLRSAQTTKAGSYLKNPPTQKRAGRVAQVVEYLPSKDEALSSSPSTTKINKM
jgi:hypothetical protein